MQPQLLRRLKQLGPGRGEQNCTLIHGPHPMADGIGELRVAHRHIIEGAMRLNVIHLQARCRAQRLKSANLIGDQRVNFLSANLDFSASEILAIIETRMRSHRHSFFFRHANGIKNPGGIACMKSARNVGGANEA